MLNCIIPGKSEFSISVVDPEVYLSRFRLQICFRIKLLLVVKFLFFLTKNFQDRRSSINVFVPHSLSHSLTNVFFLFLFFKHPKNQWIERDLFQKKKLPWRWLLLLKTEQNVFLLTILFIVTIYSMSKK